MSKTTIPADVKRQILAATPGGPAARRALIRSLAKPNGPHAQAQVARWFGLSKQRVNVIARDKAPPPPPSAR